MVTIVTLSIEGKKYIIYRNVSKNEFGYALMQENKMAAYAPAQAL